MAIPALQERFCIMEIIHIVLGKANPERMNGVNKVVYQLATNQAAAGKQVSVWGITKDLTHNYGTRNFETILFKTQKNPFSLDIKLKEKIISKKNNAIFHIHGGWIPTFYTLSKLLYKYSINFVFTPHGAYNTIAIQKSKWTKKIYFSLFEKPLLKRASKIHCLGKSEIQGVNLLYKTDKTVILPYGFEPEFTSDLTLDKSADLFTIGFVGRIDIYTKGLDLLINAFSKYIQIDKTARLWIIGDSNEKTQLENKISEKCIENITLWGSKFGKEKDILMQQFHIFAHPSRNEGLPSSVLEASAMGIPCVITEATNLGDVVTNYNSGIVIKNEDEEALLTAIIALKKQWELDKLNTLSSNSCKMVAKAFNWNYIISEFDKLYSL